MALTKTRLLKHGVPVLGYQCSKRPWTRTTPIRGFFVALISLEKQCLGLFRGFFVFFHGFFVALVLGKIYAYSPWKSLLNNCSQQISSKEETCMWWYGCQSCSRDSPVVLHAVALRASPPTRPCSQCWGAPATDSREGSHPPNHPLQ